MKILGINSNLLHDSGAAVVLDGELIAAVNEERLTRIKQQRGVPRMSVAEVLKISKTRAADIDKIHIVGYPPSKKILAFGKLLFRLSILLKFDLFKILFSKDKFQSIVSRRLGPASRERINLMAAAVQDIWGMNELIASLKKEGFSGAIRYIPHHLCHLWAAYYSSGYLDKCLVVNIEGSSFEYTTNIFTGEKGKLKELSSTKDPHSAGHFYACFTELLGFRPGFHEGKVTGLSSFGRVKEMDEFQIALSNYISKLISVVGLTLKVSPKVFLLPFNFSVNKKLPKEFLGYTKEALAWGAQKRLEEIIVELIRKALKKTGCQKIVLTGGVAANVRMNQAISELKEVKEIYVYPAMGDFGNAHGACVAGLMPKKLENLYLGSFFQSEDILQILIKSNLKFQFFENGLEEIIAEKLIANKIICLFQGRMEYGPRALGNRSIICAATDPKISNRLNKSLKRNEFMPFAPVVLFQYRHKCFKNIKTAEHSAQFMTITLNAKSYFKKTCPAVVHVDGTVRPQLLTKEQNPFYYSILKNYYQKTKNPALINTSFNIHEEPIVCSPQDAIKSFLTSGLDYLVMEKYLISKQ